MKQRGEVEKIVGISRKTLDGYCKVKLLEPTKKTDNGYRLFDDYAISKLLSIQSLAELGFKRQEIKEIFESEEWNFDTLLKRMEEKKRQLEEMMRFVEWMKEIVENLAEDLSEQEMLIFCEKIIEFMCHGKNFAGHFKKTVAEFEKADIKNDVDVNFIIQLVFLGMLCDMQPDDTLVQKKVKGLYECGMQVYTAQPEEQLFRKAGEERTYSFSELSDNAKEYVVNKLIEDMISEPEFIEALNQEIEPQCVVKMMEFIRNANQAYRDLKKHERG